MKRAVLMLLCCMLTFTLFGCADAPEQQPSPPEITQNKAPVGKMLCSVMALSCDLNGSNGEVVATSDGTAVILKKAGSAAYLVTNYHVVYNEFSGPDTQKICEAIKAKPYGAESSDGVDVQCIWVSKDYDLAVLYVENITQIFPAATVPNIDTSRNLQVADEVFISGNTEGSGIAVHNGNISRASERVTIPVSYSALDISLNLIRYDATINKGDSGGALFADDGSLIGITNARRKDNAGGYAIPISTVYPIVDQVISAHESGNKPEALELRFGAKLTEKALRTIFDENSQMPVTEYKLCVSSLEAGSVGSIFLQEDDVILGVSKNGGDEIKISRSQQLEEFLISCTDNDTLVWRYKRGESELTYEITVSALQMQSIN